jgi:lysophospholipase L1-like esterase
VAVVGDSITAGNYYVEELARALPRYQFENFGIIGRGTSDILGRLQEALPGGYDEVIIQGGLNDIGRPDAEGVILGNLERMVRAAKQAGKRVILLSLTPWHEQPQLIHDINSKLRWKSTLWGADDFVDIWTPLADASGALRSDLVGDSGMRVHPNREGHRLIAQKILRDAF